MVDIFIAGSGPVATGFLLGLPADQRMSIKLFTTVESSVDAQKSISHHAKLNVQEKLYQAGDIDGFPITSGIGGLSNAWGGVLVDGGFDDFKELYQSDLIDKCSYSSACETVLGEFSRFLNVKLMASGGDRRFYALSANNKYCWESGGLSTKPLLESICSSRGITIENGELLQFTEEDDGLINLITSNGTFKTKVLVLATGVPGSVKILRASGYESRVVDDHIPYQALVLKFKRDRDKLGKTTSPIDEIVTDAPITGVFYSPHRISKQGLYKISKVAAKIRVLLVQSFLGIEFNFVQVWGENTSIRVNSKFGLLKTVVWLIKKRCFPIFFRKTRAGNGFHFLGEIPSIPRNVLCTSGMVARRLPNYHPSFMHIVHAFLSARLVSGRLSSAMKVVNQFLSRT